MCGEAATHKVGEEIPWDEPTAAVLAGAKPIIPGPDRHNFTAYVCCKHFRSIFGPAVFCAPAARGDCGVAG
jgi:hypothetical protein